MSAIEVKTKNNSKDNNAAIHKDPLNHIEVSSLGKDSLDKEDTQESP